MLSNFPVRGYGDKLRMNTRLLVLFLFYLRLCENFEYFIVASVAAESEKNKCSYSGNK